MPSSRPSPDRGVLASQGVGRAEQKETMEAQVHVWRYRSIEGEGGREGERERGREGERGHGIRIFMMRCETPRRAAAFPLFLAIPGHSTLDTSAVF